MLKKQTALSAIINNIFWKFNINFLSIIKHIMIASLIGLSGQLDIFYMSLTIIGIIITSWAVVFDNIAIPKLVSLNKIDNKKFETLASTLLLLTILISVFFCFIISMFPHVFSSIAIGFDNEKKILLEDSFWWFLPAIAFYLPLSFLSSVFRSIRNFTIVIMIEFISSVIIISCIFFYSYNYHVLYWSYSLGISISFFLSYFILLKKINLFRFNLMDKNLKLLLPSFFPLIILHSSFFIFTMTDRLFVSFLSEGDISALAYATVLVFSFPHLIGIPNYFLTIYSEQKNLNDRNLKFNDTISLAIFFSIPCTMFLIVSGENIISILLERGAFEASDTKRVYNIIVPLSCIILPVAVQVALDQIYQVEKKFKNIILIKLMGLILNILLNAFFIFELKLGVVGASIATTISYWFVLLLSLKNLTRISIYINWKRHLTWFLWIFSHIFLFIILAYYFEFNKNSNFLSLVLNFVLILISLVLCCLYYKGMEKKLIKFYFSKIVNFKI